MFYLYFHEAFCYFSIPTNGDIEQAFHQFFPNPRDLDIPSQMEKIRRILKKENRHLLNVFSLDRDDDVAKTIFKAIFASMYSNEVKDIILLYLFDSEK
jgi:hypothetical protein